MKTVLFLSALLCAALAAPSEDKQNDSEEAVVVLKEDVVAAPEMEDEAMMKDEEFVAESSRNARFNFCPDGWFSQGSRCFKFVSSRKTWFLAEEYCNSLGGHLASTTSPKEYSFLQQMTQTAGQSVAWLGGFRLQNQWMWIDREGFYYTNWYSQSSSSSCPCLYLSATNGWANTQCTNAYSFICSKNPFGC